MTEEIKPWHEFKPGVPAQIEGTEVPLVTDQPVEVVPKLPKKGPPQTETLFGEAESKKTTSQKTAERPSRPYRPIYTDTTDRSLRALRAGLEGDNTPMSDPDADIDEVFGADNARRIVQ
jgi:hypothetical protein